MLQVIKKLFLSFSTTAKTISKNMQYVAIITLIFSVIAAIPQIKEILTTPGNVNVLFPRRMADIDNKNPRSAIVFDTKYDQVIFYNIERKSLDNRKHILVHFPFELVNSGDEKLNDITVTFEFCSEPDGTIKQVLQFDKSDSPFLYDIPMKTMNPTGTGIVTRQVYNLPDRAYVKYIISELWHDKMPHFFEFYFSPAILPVAVVEGGAVASVGIYDLKVIVKTQKQLKTYPIKLYLVPSDSPEEFNEGVKVFSLLYDMQKVKKLGSLKSILWKVPWIGRHVIRETEHMEINPGIYEAVVDKKTFTAFRVEADNMQKAHIPVPGKRH